MADPFALALRGATDAAFLVGVEDVIVKIVGALPSPKPLYEPDRRLGYRLINETIWTREIQISVYPATVKASEWDFGDIEKVTRVLAKPHLKILRVGTVLERISTTTDGLTDYLYWTDATHGILSADLKVVRTRGPELSPDYETGTDKVTFTLEPEVPIL